MMHKKPKIILLFSVVAEKQSNYLLHDLDLTRIYLLISIVFNCGQNYPCIVSVFTYSVGVTRENVLKYFGILY